MLISNRKPLSQLLKTKGILNWETALNYVRSIPSGRPSNRTDFSLVITEQRGSCSSKHALLKQLAIENGWDDVRLFIGIYKMTEQNTPGIGKVLSVQNIDYIPEAHCYLKRLDMEIDVTSTTSHFKNIKGELLEEIEIKPHQVSEFKVDYHKKFIEKWLLKSSVSLTFKEVWTLREQCINNLSS